MADISAFPTLTDVLYCGQNIIDCIAGATIKAGMVVAFAATGVSKTVHPAVKGTTAQIVGVAMNNASSGDHVAVAGPGCTAKVANADGSTGIDAGDQLEDNDNAVGGTVSTVDLSASGTTCTTKYVAGIAFDDIAGAGSGYMIVTPGTVTQVNAS